MTASSCNDEKPPQHPAPSLIEIVEDFEGVLHPAARTFPVLQEAVFQVLLNDIKEHGQRQAIITLDGKILDGRSRWRACYELGIQPLMQEWTGKGDPFLFVLTANMPLRMLTPSQRAAVVLQFEPAATAQAKNRMADGGKRAGRGRPLLRDDDEEGTPISADPVIEHYYVAGEVREYLARLAGVGRTLISDAASAIAREPRLLEVLKRGIITVSEAKQVSWLDDVERAAAMTLFEAGDVRAARKAASAYTMSVDTKVLKARLEAVVRAWPNNALPELCLLLAEMIERSQARLCARINGK